MNFDIQTYLKDIKSRQRGRYNRTYMRESIDTESLFTDRSEENTILRYSKRKNEERPVAVKIVEIRKPYIVEDYFPKAYNSRSIEKYSKNSSSNRSSSTIANKENISSLFNSSSNTKKSWDDRSQGKVSSHNPLVSFDYRSSASPSPNPNHRHKPTGDFPQPYKAKPKLIQSTLTLCTCILSGKLYTHTKGCTKVPVTVTHSMPIKKLSIVEACIKIQREFRKYLKKSRKLSIDFPFYVDNSKCKSKKVLSSIMESYSFSKDSESIFHEIGESDRFLDRVFNPGEVIKDFRSEFEESIDFELSNTFK